MTTDTPKTLQLIKFHEARNKFTVGKQREEGEKLLNELKLSLFSSLMEHIRKGDTEQAITILDAKPEFVNKPENSLDMVSVGRFTTPFLLSCTHNNNDILHHILTDDKFDVNYLTQSHCGQQALAHAVVRSDISSKVEEKQVETIRLLVDSAKKKLSPDDYKKFLLGGGIWERTALYNSFEVSKNTKAADVVLGAISKAGHIKDAREQLLQLNRPIYFYAHTPKQLETLLFGLNDAEKKEALLHKDDVDSTALHWAKTPELANHILNIAPELATTKDFDGLTPAETAFSAGLKNVSDMILAVTGDKKQDIEKNINSIQQKKQLQLNLKEFIDAVASDKDVTLETKKNLQDNFKTFQKGTQDFLKSHRLLQGDISTEQETSKLDRFDYEHQFGIENEFHMPRQTEPAIKSLLKIFNQELPEPTSTILAFGQDPEPSVLPNSPDGVAVEVVSPIIRTKGMEKKFFQLCDIAQDLGANKNSTSGIHIHVGCQKHLTTVNQGLSNNTDVTNEETQIAFLKTFLQVVQEARPIFDSLCRSQDRQDYPKAWDSKLIQALDLATNVNAKSDYIKKVNSLKDFEDLKDFTLEIGRGKYVLVAPPKDNKGTIEIRELKNRDTNAVGMNNQEIENIFKFVHDLAKLTTEILQGNPPIRGEIYKPVLEKEAIKNITLKALGFSADISKMLEKSLSSVNTPLRRHKIEVLKSDISHVRRSPISASKLIFYNL